MRKQLMIVFALLATSLIVNAQKEYRLAKTTGQLKLNINGAIIEGYDGKEIIFSNQNTSNGEVDERAKGLLPISSSGYTDNTGLGISVKETGQEVTVNTIAKNFSDILEIKVPRGIKISFANNSSQNYEDIVIRNVKSEIEVSTNFNNIKLENNSGPMNINTINGSVEAIFNNDIIGPLSIISIHDFVDVTLPSKTKANIELTTNFGRLYAAKEFIIDVDTNKTEKVINKNTTSVLTGKTITTITNLSATGINGNSKTPLNMTSGEASVSIGYGYNTGEKIKGKLNGGGVNLILKSNNNNVYLRQK